MGRMSDMEISIEELVKENELLIEANEELKAEVARLERLYAITSDPKPGTEDYIEYTKRRNSGNR